MRLLRVAHRVESVVSEHYSGNDPETGCGLMVLAGLALFGVLAVVVLLVLR